MEDVSVAVRGSKWHRRISTESKTAEVETVGMGSVAATVAVVSVEDAAGAGTKVEEAMTPVSAALVAVTVAAAAARLL